MSTKTTFKRVALVAVAALGLGVLTSVAPASAVTTITSVSVGTPGAARAGGTSLIPVTFNFASDSSDTFTVGARIQTAPTGSNAVNMTAGTVTGSSVMSITADASGNIQYAADTTNSYLQVGGASAAAVDTVVTIGATATTSATVNFNFSPDVAGTYTFLFWAGGTTWSASYAQATGSVVTAGAPASITITKVSSTIPDTDTTNGAVVAVTLKDAAGTATRLAAGESLTISDSSAETTIQAGPGTGGATITSFGAGDDYLAGGSYYARIVSADGAAADETVTLTVAGSGGLIASSVTTNTTLSVVNVDAATPVSAIALTKTTGYSTTGIAGTVDYVTSKSSHGFTVTATANTAAVKYPVVITLGNGIVVASTVSFAADKTTASLTVSAAVALADTNAVKVLVDNQELEFSYAAAAAATLAVDGITSVLSATAGSTTWKVQAVDQFAVGIQYVPVSVAVAGRNTVLTKSIGVTDADGYITYTHKDAGTTGTKDTLTFTSAGLADALGTVTYGTVTVAKVSFTGGSTTAGVADATPTTNAIEADDTPESAEVAAAVTLTDASGNLLAGVPVTFSVDKTGAAINSTQVTVYTNSAGKAVSAVYAWLAGTYTVSATAGGVTATGSYTFANSRAADARVLSAKSADGIVTATVVDRFGNPVSGATVYASRTSGTGYFGTGVSKTSSTTGTDGTAEFTLIGTADVKVSTLSYDAVAGTNAAGQTCALAGNIDCAVGATAATAFTATTAGTTTVAAANVGSTYAPAGVSAVTVSVSNNAAAENAQAATDAAAEATDAANAATDAANAAAEAADAATAAAQDAADAVAALSAQVSTMMASLKAQLTALTNLVIKIQKKVKA